MNKKELNLEKYNRMLEDNPTSFHHHSILRFCDTQCFEDKDHLLSFLIIGCEYSQQARKQYIDAIDHCFAKRWIKYIDKSDIEFDQSFLRDDPLQIQDFSSYTPYTESSIGLSYEGACIFNSLELQVNKIKQQRLYEDVIKYIVFDNNFLILQGLYTNAVKDELDQTVERIYCKQKKVLEKNIEISFVNPYEVGHWYPRRYIKLDKGYRAEISYTVW